jgi:hypothetical protein
MKTKLIRFTLEMAAIYGCILAVRWPLDHAYDPTTVILTTLVSGIGLTLGFILWQRAKDYGITKTILCSFPASEFEDDLRLRTALRLIKEAAEDPLRQLNPDT